MEIEAGRGRGVGGGGHPSEAERAAAAAAAAATARLLSGGSGASSGWPRHTDTPESASDPASEPASARSHTHFRSHSHSRSHSSHGERSVRFGACDNRELDEEQPPRPFAAGFHVFSTLTKTPIPTGFVQRARTASARRNRGGGGAGAESGTGTGASTSSDGSRVRRKHFFPLVKASSPLVLLQSMPPALPHDPDALEPFTPQRVLARQQAAREQALALERAASLANQPRHELGAEQLYELDRQLAMQAHALAIDAAPARRAGSAGPGPGPGASSEVPSHGGDSDCQSDLAGHGRGRSVSMDKYQPTPSPAPLLAVVRSNHSDADELLARKFRVPSPRKKQQQQRLPARDPDATVTAAAAAAIAAGDAAASPAAAAIAHPTLPPNQRAFAKQAQERLWEAERRALLGSRAAATADAAWASPPAAASPSPSYEPSLSPSHGHGRSRSRSPSRAAAASRPPPSASMDAHRRHLSVLPEEMASITAIAAAEDSPHGSETVSVAAPHAEAESVAGQRRDGSATERIQIATPPPSTNGASSARRHGGTGTGTGIGGPGLARARARAHALLSDPDMRLVRSQGPVRPRKEGSPARLLARAHAADDPCVMLTPLTDALQRTPRTALIAAVGKHADELRDRLAAKEEERSRAPLTRPTAMILLGPAALQLTQQQQPRRPSTLAATAAGEEKQQQQQLDGALSDDTSAPPPGGGGGGGGGVSGALADSALGANVPRLDIAASIPPASLSPRKTATAAAGGVRQSAVSAPAPATSFAAGDAEANADASGAPQVFSLSGTEAASAGRLARSMAPLSAALSANGMGSVLTGLTTLSQMLLPPAPSARKMSELYAHYQRHLLRTAEYFATERDAGRRARERLLHERASSARAQALLDAGGGPTAPPVEPPPSTLSALHRVDSQGFIVGPDRSTPSLAPGAVAFVAVPVPVPVTVPAAAPDSASGHDHGHGHGGAGPGAGASAGDGVSSAAVSSRVVPASVVHLSNFSKLSSAGGLRRRGGGNLGMLEGESDAELAESLAVLADMVARSDASDNEQALRVLSAFDRNRALRLPPLLLRRAQDLHDLLDRRAEEAARAETDALLAAAAAKAAPAAASAGDGAVAEHGSSESEGEQGAAADQFFALRAVSRRKAKAKFRLASQMPLFGSDSGSGGGGGKGSAPSKSGMSPQPPSRSRSQLLGAGAGATAEGVLADAATQRRMLDAETARRIIGALTAAATEAEQRQQQQRAQASTPATARSSCNNSRSSNSSSRGGGGPGRGPALAQDPASRIVGAALPPTFMSLYDSFGVAPSTDGSGLAARPAAAPAAAVCGTGQTLLDVVRARANLERKLRQDAFVARLGGRGGAEGEAEDPARLRRMEELHGLQLEEAKEKEEAAAMLSRRSTGGSSVRGSVASPSAASRAASIASHSNRGSNNGPLVPAPQAGSPASASSPSAAGRTWSRTVGASSRDRGSLNSDNTDQGSLAPAPDCGSPVAAVATAAVVGDPSSRLSSTTTGRLSAHFPLPSSALHSALIDSDSDSDSDLDVADSLRRMAHQRAASQQQPPPPVIN